MNEDENFTNNLKQQEEILSIFKSTKDKILTMIQKDTNAGVRDASVALLTTFKAYLYESSLVNEAIQSLPKYRVSEINKDAAEKLKSL